MKVKKEVVPQPESLHERALRGLLDTNLPLPERCEKISSTFGTFQLSLNIPGDIISTCGLEIFIKGAETAASCPSEAWQTLLPTSNKAVAPAVHKFFVSPQGPGRLWISVDFTHSVSGIGFS